MNQQRKGRSPAWLCLVALSAPLALLAFTLLAPRGYFQLISEKELVQQQQLLSPQSERLFYLNHQPQSASWYSQGGSLQTGTGAGAPRLNVFWLAIHREDGQTPDWGCTLRYRPTSGLFDLYRCQPPVTPE